MTYVPTTVTSNSVSILVGDSMRSITNSHPNYQDIRLAVKEERYDDAISMLDIAKQIVDFGEGKVEVKAGVVYYDGRPVNNTLTRRILSMKTEGFNIDPMIRFMENLMLNPSHSSVNELYDFLEACNLPITEDGHFLAYKMVRGNFTDVRTGTFDNTPGKTVEEPRNMVDDNRERTCSNGLHFCSEGYLGHYGGEIVVIVKVNPRDVVSVPADYNNTKARCCRYEVVREAKIATNTRDSASEFNTSVVTNDALAGNDSVDDDAPFRGVRNEADGSVTALFEFSEAARRLCPLAENRTGALRKRLSRGSVTSEQADIGNGVIQELIRCPLDPYEVEEWSDYLDADSEEEYEDDDL